MLIVETPGAGGYGPPADRSKQLIAEDRLSGKFTDAFIERSYSLIRAAE
jgi:N-methylhydantoinase B